MERRGLFVQPEVARSTRACAYDRTGAGYSTRNSKPHTSHEMASELDQLLVRAKIPGPYVLVAHSFGGLNVRLYASEHPEKVAGMVLVDASFDVSMFDVLRDRLHLDIKTPASRPPSPGQEIDEAAWA